MSVRGRKGQNRGKISPIIFMCVAGIRQQLVKSNQLTTYTGVWLQLRQQCTLHSSGLWESVKMGPKGQIEKYFLYKNDLQRSD